MAASDKDKDPALEALDSRGGCFWVVIVLILCITAYNLAELWITHRH
jgi:hypothetical protein